MIKQATRSKHWTEMSVEELRNATKGLEEIGLADMRALSAAQRARWNNAKRGRGQPRQPLPVARVFTTIAPALLAKTDALAKRRKVSRAVFIAEGLNMVLSKTG